jgi:hypothetical protein
MIRPEKVRVTCVPFSDFDSAARRRLRVGRSSAGVWVAGYRAPARRATVLARRRAQRLGRWAVWSSQPYLEYLSF